MTATTQPIEKAISDLIDAEKRYDQSDEIDAEGEDGPLWTEIQRLQEAVLAAPFNDYAGIVAKLRHYLFRENIKERPQEQERDVSTRFILSALHDLDRLKGGASKTAMPPEIAEYVAACIAYDGAWPVYRKDDAHRPAHDRALERLEKAEAVIVKKQVKTEWDAFGRMLVLARISLGGSEINDEEWQEFGREWADALGAPEAIAAMEKVG